MLQGILDRVSKIDNGISKEKYLNEVNDILVNRRMKNDSLSNITGDKFIKVDFLKDYVQEVMVTPFAKDWFCDLVEAVCGDYGLSFIGKSRLY